MTGSRILLTGATGSMGLAAAQALRETGHQVIGIARTSEGGASLNRLGATPVEASLFDERAVREAVRGVDAVAHFATSIPSGFWATRRRAWRMNDRLRREGTRNLIAAAEAEGVRRIIFESISLAYPHRGDQWIDESQTLSPPSAVMQTAIEAEEMLAEFNERGGESVSLRFGRLYGPGRASRELIGLIQKRQMPVVGSGDNYVSSIQVEDAGRAVAAALDVAPGVYNVVDDEPVTQRVLLEAIADTLHAPPPPRVPYIVARMILGHIAKVLTVSHRVSNRRFCGATAWRPRFQSALLGWRQLAEELREARGT